MLVYSFVVLAAGAADAAHGAHKKSGLPQLDGSHFVPQLLWLALTFGVLYLVLSKFALPAVGEVIDERKQRIKRDLDEAERMKSETEKALATYEQALADARAKGSQIARDTRNTLAAETDRQRGAADAQANAKVADAEKRIGAMKARALGEVNAIAADTASAIVEALSGAKASADEIKSALAS